jgi:hypothetical protein
MDGITVTTDGYRTITASSDDGRGGVVSVTVSGTGFAGLGEHELDDLGKGMLVTARAALLAAKTPFGSCLFRKVFCAAVAVFVEETLPLLMMAPVLRPLQTLFRMVPRPFGPFGRPTTSGSSWDFFLWAQPGQPPYTG